MVQEEARMHCCLDQFFASVDNRAITICKQTASVSEHDSRESVSVTTASPEEMVIDPGLLTDAEMVVNCKQDSFRSMQRLTLIDNIASTSSSLPCP